MQNSEILEQDIKMLKQYALSTPSVDMNNYRLTPEEELEAFEIARKAKEKRKNDLKQCFICGGMGSSHTGIQHKRVTKIVNGLSKDIYCPNETWFTPRINTQESINEFLAARIISLENKLENYERNIAR